MRLLHYNDVGDLIWTEFSQGNIPLYAILSHTWGIGEVSFEDLVNNRAKGKAGYRKILFCGEQAARDHLQYFWVDTCCIDKRNSHELSKAINSMFRWYQTAVKCYVFLSDVSTPSIAVDPLYQSIWETAFRKSKWFTRGWTLQELIAPASVEFFSLQHQRLGDKQSLKQQIFEITGVPLGALLGHPPNKFSVQERMNWAAERCTTEEEDGAYCLLGIFGVFMPLIYGEGRRNAFLRLKEEIGKQSKDLDTEFMTSERNPAGTQKNGPNEHAQSRLEENPKFDVGLSGYLNILILGETGVGKSTFLNALVNYIVFENLDEALDANELLWLVPCNFSTQIMDRSNPYQEIEDRWIQVGSSSGENDSSNGNSATQEVIVHPITSKYYTIRLINTPSIEDTRGVEYAKKNIANVFEAVSSYEKLHGILLLLKSNSAAQLTTTFQCFLEELLNHLPTGAARNLIFGFTNTRSSNYTPGDTFGPLKRLLGQHRNVGLTLSMNTTYCFDSESFRYLAASKSGVEMPNKGDFDRSWRQSQDEIIRMIKYLKSVPPIETKSTMTVIRARQIISELMKPMVEVSQLIHKNIAHCKDKRAELRDIGLKGYELRSAISSLDQTIKEYVQERDTIRLAAATFSLYLRINSITPYNDAAIAYLDFLIKTETDKVRGGGNNRKLVVLKEELQQHKETVQNLTRSRKTNANSVDLSEERVEKIIQQLYDLEHFGKALRSIQHEVSQA